MGKIETLEKEIESLTPDEMVEFRTWFMEYDSEMWDRKIEDDIEAGKLDDLAKEAMVSHKQGKNTGQSLHVDIPEITFLR